MGWQQYQAGPKQECDMVLLIWNNNQQNVSLYVSILLPSWQAFRASLTMSFTNLTIEIGQWHSLQEILAQLPSWGFQPIDNEVPKMNKSSIPCGCEPLTCCFTRTFPLLIFFIATDSLCGKKYGKRCNQFMNQPHNSFSMPFTT